MSNNCKCISIYIYTSLYIFKYNSHSCHHLYIEKYTHIHILTNRWNSWVGRIFRSVTPAPLAAAGYGQPVRGPTVGDPLAGSWGYAETGLKAMTQKPLLKEWIDLGGELFHVYRFYFIIIFLICHYIFIFHQAQSSKCMKEVSCSSRCHFRYTKIGVVTRWAPSYGALVNGLLNWQLGFFTPSP